MARFGASHENPWFGGAMSAEPLETPPPESKEDREEAALKEEVARLSSELRETKKEVNTMAHDLASAHAEIKKYKRENEIFSARVKEIEKGTGGGAVKESGAEKEKEDDLSSPDLIHATPPADRANAWEIARNTYVHTADREEIEGLIQKKIAHVDTLFPARVDHKDREWIRKRIVQELEGFEAYHPEVFLPKIGLKKGSLRDLRPGVDTLNLLPVFSSEIVMAPIIKDAQMDREGLLNNKESVVKALQKILEHAQKTEASL